MGRRVGRREGVSLLLVRPPLANKKTELQLNFSDADHRLIERKKTKNRIINYVPITLHMKTKHGKLVPVLTRDLLDKI
jgi:hypothetical protein